MTIFDSLVLGAVQGITEFIPISSSGHLILAQKFLDLPNNFTFDVLLNIGTLVALLIFFRDSLLRVARKIMVERNLHLLWLVIIGVLPTFAVGFLFADFFDGLGKHTWLIALSLLLVGALMLKFGRAKTKIVVSDETKATKKDAAWVGLAQVLALFPGVSRSGSTVLAGLNGGFSTEAAANFSFLLALPTILGAVAHTLLLKDGFGFIADNPSLFIFGNLASFVFGSLGAMTLLRVLKKRGLGPFGWYRVVLSALLVVLLATKVL